MKNKITLFIFLLIFMYVYPQNEIRPLAPAINFTGACFLRNDTVLCCHIDKKTDSVVIVGTGIKISRKKWRFQNENGSFSISKYKKVKESDWFKKYNTEFLNADFECEPKGLTKIYDTEGYLDMIVYRSIFGWVYRKQIIRKNRKREVR
jgi:hypothetical protein